MLIKLRVNLIKKTKDRSKKLIRKIYSFIPSVFTFLNAIFGFLSILKSFDNDFKMAALFIALSGVMDLIDGKIARKLNLCSYFGMELDSLSDAISFCLAPTILLYCWMSCEGLSIWHLLVFFLYLCAGIARLAKFNINAFDLKASNKFNFIGLPTTASALFITSMVITFDNILFCDKFYINLVLSLITILSILMVSNLKFKSLKSVKLLRVSTLLFIGFNFLAIYLVGFVCLFLEFILYIIFNVFKNIRVFFKR